MPFRLTRYFLFILLVLICPFKYSLSAQEAFVESAQQAGIEFNAGGDTPGGGISFIDFSGDGLDDLSIASSAGLPMAFYVNDGQGAFMAVDLGLSEVLDNVKQVLWNDIDNDGDPDLLLTGRHGRNYLFENQGELQLVDITERAGLLIGTQENFGAAWGDYNRDGYLDLFLNVRPSNDDAFYSTNRLFHNNGDNTFSDVTVEMGLLDENKIPFCASFFDMDNDLWPDLFVAEDKASRNLLYRNEKGSGYEDISRAANADDRMFAMSVGLGDYDGNGFEDIYVTNTVGSRLLSNSGANYFKELARESATEFRHGIGWGANFFDVDHDMDQDLYVSGMLVGAEAVSSTYYENVGDGLFESGLVTFEGDTVESFANALGDFNNDGALDIAVNNGGEFSFQLWKNEVRSGKSWIKFELEGILSNRDGVGARLELYEAGQRQIRSMYSAIGFLGQNSGQLHFGTGDAQFVDSLQVFWPSGHIDTYYDLAANGVHRLVEGEGGAYDLQMRLTPLETLCQGSKRLLSPGLFGEGIEYQWSTGATTPTIVITESGLYSVEVTGAEFGTLYSENMDIEVLAFETPNVQLSTRPVSCGGSSDGSISVAVDYAGEYELLWSTGETGTAITGLDPGAYGLSLRTAAGCVMSYQVYIAEPDPLLADPIIIKPETGRNNGAIRMEVFGGTAPYSYDWFDVGRTNKERTAVGAGTYEVLITDARGCTLSKTIAVESITNDPVTSLDDLVLAGKLLTYPNPTQGDVRIELPQSSTGTIEVQILDAKGQYLRHELAFPSYGEALLIPGELLDPGLNLLLLSVNDQLYVQKVIRQ